MQERKIIKDGKSPLPKFGKGQDVWFAGEILKVHNVMPGPGGWYYFINEVAGAVSENELTKVK